MNRGLVVVRIEVIRKGNNKTIIPTRKDFVEQKELLLSCGMISVPELEYNKFCEPELLIKGYEGKDLIGIAGINKRHHFFSALFVSVLSNKKNKGYGTR